MKPLNQWARDFGYNDFDTYIRAGGSIADAARDIHKRIGLLQDALTELGPTLHWVRPEATRPALDAIVDDAETEDEPADPDNAHVQGAEGG